MQKLLRSSKLSCSKPFITLLKQQISNCCNGKNPTGNVHCFSTAIHISSSTIKFKMAVSTDARELQINTMLCFILNKLNKLDINRVYKSVIDNFNSVDISLAKTQLLDDARRLGLNLPRYELPSGRSH